MNPNDTADTRCEAIASRQHGAITREQAWDAGMSPQAVRRRSRAGRWHEIFPGVFHLAPAPSTIRMRLMAAALWSRGGAVSHRSAAFLWGLDGFENRHGSPPVEVTVVRGARCPPNLLLHRCHALPSHEVTEIEGIRVTCPARTLLDLAGRVSPRRLEIALESALRLGLVDLSGVKSALQKHAGRGRSGLAALRALLDDRRPEERPTESLFESRILPLLRDSGLPSPVRQLALYDEAGGLIARPDFCFPDHRVAIEAQSWAFHAGKRAWRNDMRRLSALGARGWRVIYITWDDLERPREIAETIRRALHANSRPAIGAARDASASGGIFR